MSTQHILPPGRYYVGDLCVPLAEIWDSVGDVLIKDCEVLDGVFTLSNGRIIASFGTSFGDGRYSDQYDNSYPVDSGCIGCTLADGLDITDDDGYVIVDFQHPFRVWSTDGVIHFGHLCIDTNDYNNDNY